MFNHHVHNNPETIFTQNNAAKEGKKESRACPQAGLRVCQPGIISVNVGNWLSRFIETHIGKKFYIYMENNFYSG